MPQTIIEPLDITNKTTNKIGITLTAGSITAGGNSTSGNLVLRLGEYLYGVMTGEP